METSLNASNGGSPSLGRLTISRAAGSIGAGKYSVFGNLGRGGMADIQLGAAKGPKGFSKLVVVKRLRAALADDLAVVSMFMDEARLAARLNHPNVVNTYEFGEENGAYFIVMEYLDGQSLNEVLQAVAASKKPVPPTLWARVLADALAGLHYAHELRDYDGTHLHVVHRDVSPQNIVVTYDGRIKLVDFGIAKATMNVARTESQVIKGKLAYMAPEQADPTDGIALDRRADIFAMGIVLWECLTGKRLITGDVRSALTKIVDMEFERPSKLDPDVPPELDAITMRALERNLDERFQTAEEMRDALHAYLRAKGDFVGEKEIGALVGGLFAKEREDAKRQIGEHMPALSSSSHRLKAESGALDSSHALAARGSSEALESGEGSPEASLTESVQSLRAVRTSSARPRETEPSRWNARSGGILLAAGAAIVLAVVALRPAGKRVVGVEPAPLTVAPSAALADRGLARVTVHAQPSDAVVSFDGAPVANPFVGTFERDEVQHRLRVTRPGYVPVTKLLRLDRDEVTLDVTLDKSEDVPAPSAAPSASAPSAKPTSAPSAQPVKPTAKPSPPASAKPSPRLDDDPWR
jgi:serine/threonine protein kinase